MTDPTDHMTTAEASRYWADESARLGRKARRLAYLAIALGVLALVLQFIRLVFL